jgi:uncharacterized protein YegJ (DUF2314 family)
MTKLRQLLAPLLIAALVAPAPLLAQGRNSSVKISGQDVDEVVNVPVDDAAMLAAIAEAQRTLPEFLAVLAKRDPAISRITFKFALGGKEHIWVSGVERDGEFLTGRLSNVPVMRGFSYGQPVRVPMNQISDWGYRGADGVMRGHFTTRANMPRFSPALRKEILADFGWK